MMLRRTEVMLTKAGICRRKLSSAPVASSERPNRAEEVAT
jgi:hypothetical protein